MDSARMLAPATLVADDRRMSATMTRPAVGSTCRAVADQSLRLAIVGTPVVWIPSGTLLRITRLDERWDNAHALIARSAQVMASLRVLDGPSRGEEIAVVIAADAVPDPDGGESKSWHLPDWLALVDPGATGGR